MPEFLDFTCCVVAVIYIVGIRAPLEVVDIVVFLVLIFMVYAREIIGIRKECHSNKSVNCVGFLFVSLA